MKPEIDFKRLVSPTFGPIANFRKFRKLKTVMPSLKSAAPLSSGCPSSYIRQTVRHLQTRFREHLGCNGTMRRHIETCDPSTSLKIHLAFLLKQTNILDFLPFKPFFINVLKLDLNTKDECRIRTLQ